MSVATITKAPTTTAPKATKATKATKAPVMTDADYAKVSAELVKRWTMADAGETKAQDLFKAAGIAWENARVIKVRVAFAAAMVKPNGKEANLLNACRILFTNPADSAAKRTKDATAKKSTLRNYVDAGTALDAKSLGFATGEPTEEERKIVAQAFREGNKRDKAEAAGEQEGTTGGEQEGDGSGEGNNNADALTFVNLVAYVAQMNKTLEIMQAGDVVISEREAASMADMLNGFQMKLSAYAEGK
jgi:hypothetical protein